MRGIPGGGSGAALRAPDEPAPAGAAALDDRTEARRAIGARNGASRGAVAITDGTELFDDEEVDLDETPAAGSDTSGSSRGGARPAGGDRVHGGAVR